MTGKIEELQIDIGVMLDRMIPAEYKTAYVFYELGTGVAPSFWFCYIDAESGKIIPADGIEERKDIVINNLSEFKNSRSKLIYDVQQLQKTYIAEYGREWFGITYKLNDDGRFDIEFDYDKPTGSLQERREKWCMKHLGQMPPKVTVDMLMSHN